jgi:hypothetical protein
MLPVAAFGQMDKDEIKKTFENYFRTVQQKDNAQTLEYIYPKLFEHFPKDRMLEAMDRMKADTTTIIALGNPSVTGISEPLELDGIKYARIRYSFKMTMTIVTTGEETESTEDEDFNPADFTYEMLKEIHGDKNVVYDRENSKIDINVTNEMYAINDPTYTGWKFLEKKDSMKPVLEKLLPKKVLKKL